MVLYELYYKYESLISVGIWRIWTVLSKHLLINKSISNDDLDKIDRITNLTMKNRLETDREVDKKKTRKTISRKKTYSVVGLRAHSSDFIRQAVFTRRTRGT